MEEAAVAWQRFTDGGITMDRPADWLVEIDRADGSLHAYGPADEILMVLPFFHAGGLNGSAAGRLLAGFAAAHLDAAFGDPHPVGQNGVRMLGAAGTGTAVAAVTWVSAGAASAGFLYGLQAPRGTDPTDDVARMLASIEIAGEPAHEPAAGVSYRTFEDPTEGAFAIDVPTDWDVAGGITRLCTGLPQMSVTARSPDGALTVEIGNDHPWFTEPTEFGLQPGGTYLHGGCYPSPVFPYLPGVAYVTELFLPHVAPDARVVGTQDLPSLAAALSATGIATYHAGEVTYAREGGREGIILVVTDRINVPAGLPSQWQVDRLYRAEAPAERTGEAAAVALRMADSLWLRPEWVQANTQLAAAQAQIVAEMAATVSQTMSDAYWGRVAVDDRLSQERSQATLGVADYVDPMTGDVYRLDHSPTYHWVSPDGTLVGTDTAVRPDADFRQLMLLH